MPPNVPPCVIDFELFSITSATYDLKTILCLTKGFAKIVLNQCQSVPVQFGQILSVSPRYVLGSNSQAGEFASE